MINKKYGGSAETREEALYCVLNEFEKDILSKNEFCDRTFRIYEERIYIKDYKKYKTYCDGTEYIFKINEIPVTLQEFVLPKKEDIEAINNRKYNFKERIKILLKGKI